MATENTQFFYEFNIKNVNFLPRKMNEKIIIYLLIFLFVVWLGIAIVVTQAIRLTGKFYNILNLHNLYLYNYATGCHVCVDGIAQTHRLKNTLNGKMLEKCGFDIKTKSRVMHYI